MRGAFGSGLLLILTAGCLASAIGEPEPLGLELRSHLDGAVFYEGEPIYATFELENVATDTAYVPPWYLGDDWLVATLTRRDGQPVPKRLWFVDFFFPPGYRGDPFAPAATLFATTPLQLFWGESSTLDDLLFLHHLRVGEYQLDASLRADVNPPPGQEHSRYVTTAPVGFTVIARTPAQDSSYAAYEQFAARLNRRTWRAEDFADVVAWGAQRLAADSLDATVTEVLNTALLRMWAIGAVPDSGSIAALQALRARQARAQRDRPAGAAAVVAYYAVASRFGRADRSLSGELGESLAGRVAQAIERQMASIKR
jgi:hypothetical protein